MSTKTRREKRKAMEQEPVETDWLWSCPPDMPLGDIVHRLGFTTEPCTELCARAWADERHMRDDLYRALWPNLSRDHLTMQVVWDALDEDLRVACVNCRLIVLRDLPIACPMRCICCLISLAPAGA